jgi:hypothetical protein
LLHIYEYIYICCCFKGKPEAHVTFLNLFTVCSSSKTADCHLSIYWRRNHRVIHLQTDLPVYACETTNVAYPYP